MPRNLFATILTLLLTATTALGRTALSDSTDVKIPTTRSEVENSIAVSPLNSKVLLVSNNAYAGTAARRAGPRARGRRAASVRLGL